MLKRKRRRTEATFLGRYKVVLTTCIIPRSQIVAAPYMDKEHVCFYTKVHTVVDIQPIVIYNELHTVFGDQAPLLRTGQRWSKAFCEGRDKVEDEERSGSAVTETTPENIDQVRDLIDDDPYLTIDEIEEQTGLSHGTFQQIISDHLQLKNYRSPGRGFRLSDPGFFRSGTTSDQIRAQQRPIIFCRVQTKSGRMDSDSYRQNSVSFERTRQYPAERSWPGSLYSQSSNKLSKGWTGAHMSRELI